MCFFCGNPTERIKKMENAPKIAVLVVLALVVGSIFIATSKEYSKSVSDKTVEQTNNLFNSTGAGS
jgi:hypothetical protein